MAVTLTGTGGLFTRLGKEFTELNRVVSSYGTSLNNGTEAIYDQYPNTLEDAQVIDGLLTARESYRGVHNSYTTVIKTAAVNTVVEQVHRDTPLPQKTLAAALTELKTQMADGGDSINRPTTSASVAAWGSNIGNGVVNASLTNEYGDPLDMVFAEDVKFTVSGDVSTGGTQYAEVATVTGEPLRSPTAWNWPGGSGASGTVTFTDAQTTGLLTDGGFESWSSATPTYWTIVTGAATVDKSSVETVGRGTYSLKITSDGSTLTSVRQQLSTAVAPNRVYCLNLWAKMSVADASAAVRFRLTNSAGTVLANDAGTDLTYSRDTNGQIGTSFTNISTFFQTPRSLPASGGVWLEIAFTTAPSNGRILYVDHLGFVRATQLYAGGPFVAAFSKNTANAVRDYYTMTVANNLTHTSFARCLDRWLGLRDLGVYLPSAASETISDSLIS
jgi:hypothetical protein